MSAIVHVGNVLDILPTLEAGSVNCIVTSPPYWNLRDYGVDGQLGLESTPELYVANMVAVFREVRRVLRDDGTLWLNLGDSYNSSPSNQNGGASPSLHGGRVDAWESVGRQMRAAPGLKPKDMCGIPWRVAFALQADGWVLRQEVIWAKPNPMPESVTDRCTKSHEQVFMFAKAKWIGAGEPPIWLPKDDAKWLAALVDGEGSICFQNRAEGRDAATFSVRLSIVNTHKGLLDRVATICNVEGGPGSPQARRRSDGTNGRPVYSWQVTNSKAARVIAAIRPHLIAKATQADLALTVHILNQKHKGRGGYKTTPHDTDTKAKAAAACSALNHGEGPDLSWFRPIPWGRWTSQPYVYDAEAIKDTHAPPTQNRYATSRRTDAKAVSNFDINRAGRDYTKNTAFDPESAGRNRRTIWTIATQPYPEAHFATYPEKLVEPCVLAGCPVGGTVLDPFTGSGTTGAVACRLGRNFVGIELSPEYAEMAERRIAPHRDQMQLAVTP